MSKTTDNWSVDELFAHAGFRPPTKVLCKQDPRGAEYGEFRASSYHWSIHVEKWMPGATEPLYAMDFNDRESFFNWAKEEF